MNVEFLLDYNPVILALGATLFTWAVTAFGSSMVFFFKTINKMVLNSMLGFAAGVMIAASFWSLLKPAIEMAEESGSTSLASGFDRLLSRWSISFTGR